MTWAEHLLQFYNNLKPPRQLPPDIEWLYPQQDPSVMTLVEKFLRKYFNDENKRVLLLGINPGRFGAGVTGINFTAPRQLKENCGIDHHLKMQTELSAEFIYKMIAAYGGVEDFYQHHFIGSVCTLGFIKDGKNINYYDDKKLLQAVEPFIIQTLKQQLKFPVDSHRCVCIGGEKNFNFLISLNKRFHWFNEIIPLPHPRFIMQYRRKKMDEYVAQYIEALKG